MHINVTECPFAITPSGEPHELRLTVDTVKKNSRIQTINSINQAANAIIITNSTKKPLNNSVCDISSLEVYRGRDQAIEISHQGFSLSENGSIKVPVFHTYSLHAMHTTYLLTNIIDYHR